MMTNTLSITEAQRHQFDEDGFFLVEDALSPTEVSELIALADELYETYRVERKRGPHDAAQWRNIVALHPRFRQLIDHPKMLPMVVDLIGYNIQIRTSHLDVRPPVKPETAQKA